MLSETGRDCKSLTGVKNRVKARASKTIMCMDLSQILEEHAS